MKKKNEIVSKNISNNNEKECWLENGMDKQFDDIRLAFF